ncbi:MAG TPA: hypothetical protein VFN48_05870 [Solirubrobacteraceae bacterium]|nr:hypothetical protein [Solirubrobacteraceae bacterium]
MSEPVFRFVCAASALAGTPAGWAAEMLRDGEIALLPDADLEAISEIARDLDQPAIAVIRREADLRSQDGVVIAFAEHLPVVWVAPNFSDTATDWARARGPMTLLVEAGEPLGDDQRRTVDRFVASLTRQSE